MVQAWAVAVINDAPMFAQPSTEYSGNLFSGVGNMVVYQAGDWLLRTLGLGEELGGKKINASYGCSD